MATSHDFEPYLTHNTQKSPFPNSSQLEITDRDATLRLIREVRPKIIVNAAALTNVDYCETHKEEAESVNVGGARNLAEAAEKNGSPDGVRNTVKGQPPVRRESSAWAV